MKNPFLKYGYQGAEYFCDRESETITISRTMSGGASNVTLISPRRMGKTGLIKHAFEIMREDNPQAIFMYIDLLPTRSFSQFIQLFGESVLKAVEGQASLFKRIIDVLKSLRPVFSTDVITGSPTVSLTVESNEAEVTIQRIFDTLENMGKDCYIAFDEFQQIGNYPEDNVEALLRSRIQFLKNVRFIFAGSSQHMMTQMFMSAKRPFFNSTQIVTLKPINEDVYYTWANHFFEIKGGKLSRDVFHALYTSLEGHTWYMQAVLNRLYENHSNVDEVAQYQQAITSIVEEYKDYYQSVLQLLTGNQTKVLYAIASEGKVQAINESSFIKRYDLKASSSVNTSLKALCAKELVSRNGRTYELTDRFFAIYLRIYL